MIYDYKQANWQLFQSTIDNLIPINPTIKATADLEQAAKNFETAIQQATITAVPKLKKIRNQITLPAPLAYLLRLKNYSRRRFQRLRTPTTRSFIHPFISNFPYQTPTTKEYEMEPLSQYSTPPNIVLLENL